MTSQHAKRTYAARTKALRAPEKKLYKVSLAGLTSIQEWLVMAAAPYEAIEKAVKAKLGAGMKLDPATKAKSYANENGSLEMRAYVRYGNHATSMYASEAEVID